MLVKIQKYNADNILYPLVVAWTMKLYTTQNVGYTHETYSTFYIPQPRKLASRHVNMRGGKWNERSLALWRAWQHFDEWSGVLAGPAISVVIRYLICVRVAQQYPLTLWLRRVALRSFYNQSVLTFHVEFIFDTELKLINVWLYPYFDVANLYCCQNNKLRP